MKNRELHLTRYGIRSNISIILCVSAVIAILLTYIYSTQRVLATRYYSGYRWSGTSVDMCYDSFSLNMINIDGETNKFSTVASVLDAVRNDWNNEPSIFALNRINSQFCSHWNYSAALGSSGPIAHDSSILTAIYG
ncbi:MAG: hypothetical protein QW560_05130 [Candidatus Nitrosocaldus sp.]